MRIRKHTSRATSAGGQCPLHRLSSTAASGLSVEPAWLPEFGALPHEYPLLMQLCIIHDFAQPTACATRCTPPSGRGRHGPTGQWLVRPVCAAMRGVPSRDVGGMEPVARMHVGPVLAHRRQMTMRAICLTFLARAGQGMGFSKLFPHLLRALQEDTASAVPTSSGASRYSRLRHIQAPCTSIPALWNGAPPHQISTCTLASSPR